MAGMGVGANEYMKWITPSYFRGEERHETVKEELFHVNAISSSLGCSSIYACGIVLCCCSYELYAFTEKEADLTYLSCW